MDHCCSSNKPRMDTVILFDFDYSLIDCNSDPWVVNQLGAAPVMSSLLNRVPWTSLMDTMMSEIHKQGRTIEDIEASLKTVPISPEMIRAIQTSYSLGCDLQIISDANSFFIRTILEYHDLLKYFSKIHTNPASVDQYGRLRIFPYNSVAHGCNLCPPNMCKGQIVTEIQRQYLHESKKYFIYIGDGKGDFCPSLRLEKEDHVLARIDFPLWNLLCDNSEHVKSQVHGWRNAKDVESWLIHLLNA